MERTLIMIKPDAVHIADNILSELDKLGKRIRTIKVKKVDSKILEKHYEEPIKRHGEHLRGKILRFFNNKTIILALYEGEDIIRKINDKVGPTDPAKAEKGTIRGDYCDDELEKATKEDRFVRNAIHKSGSQKEFEFEFNVWKDFFN